MVAVKDIFKRPEKFRLNHVILIIIMAEFIMTTASGLITPLFSLFLVDDIGASVTVVGFSFAIYWVVKSVLQLPVARYLDKNHGEIDDYYSMLMGLFLTTTAVYLFYFVHAVWQIYLLQFLIAVGDAFIVPPFYAIFTRHLDKNQEAFEWSLRSSFSLGAGSAFGGALSGILAAAVGIRPVFLVNGTLMFIGTVILLFLRPYIRPRVPQSLAQFYEQKKA